MILLGVFILIWAALVGTNVFISYVIETMWGTGASLFSFLVLFFASIPMSWLAAVRLSAPTGIGNRNY